MSNEDNTNTKKDLSKSLKNPILDVVKSEDLNSAITETPKKKKSLPNKISPSLDKFENKLIKEREEKE